MQPYKKDAAPLRRCTIYPLQIAEGAKKTPDCSVRGFLCRANRTPAFIYIMALKNYLDFLAGSAFFTSTFSCFTVVSVFLAGAAGCAAAVAGCA